MSCYCNKCEARTEDVTIAEWLYGMKNFEEPPTITCRLCGNELESRHNVYNILLGIVERLGEE